MLLGIDDFIKKVKGLGYDAERRYNIDGDPLSESVVISEDNYYHVAIHTKHILGRPFSHIMNDVKREIRKLKED